MLVTSRLNDTFILFSKWKKFVQNRTSLLIIRLHYCESICLKSILVININMLVWSHIIHDTLSLTVTPTKQVDWSKIRPNCTNTPKAEHLQGFGAKQLRLVGFSFPWMDLVALNQVQKMWKICLNTLIVLSSTGTARENRRVLGEQNKCEIWSVKSCFWL